MATMARAVSAWENFIAFSFVVRNHLNSFGVLV
jgi:hypothetical protein